MENQKKIEMLGSYQLTSELSSQNSGFSVWGYGKKNGRDFLHRIPLRYMPTNSVPSLQKKDAENIQIRKFIIYTCLTCLFRH